MILTRLVKCKENNRIVFKGSLGEVLLVLHPDNRNRDELVLEVLPNDQPRLFTHSNPSEKGWLDDEF